MTTVLQYDDAANEFRRVAERTKHRASLARDVGEAILRNPFQVPFTNLPSGSGIVVGSLDAGHPFDMRDWPSASDLADTLVQLHEAWQRLHRAYEQLSQADRATRKSPSEIKDI